MKALMGQKARKIKEFETDTLPLFAWRPPQPLSPAARRIAMRFRVPAATAALIAVLAGLGQEASVNG